MNSHICKLICSICKKCECEKKKIVSEDTAAENNDAVECEEQKITMLLTEYKIAFDNYFYRDKLIVQEFYLSIWLFSGMLAIIYYLYNPDNKISTSEIALGIVLVFVMGLVGLSILAFSIKKLNDVRKKCIKRIIDIEKKCTRVWKLKTGAMIFGDSEKSKNSEEKKVSVSGFILAFVVLMIFLWIAINFYIPRLFK